MAGAKTGRKEKPALTFFEREAVESLRMELYRRRITFKQLSKGFELLGETVPAATLSNRVNRGKFPYSFVFQCMHAMNMRDLRVNPAPMSTEELAAARAAAKKKTRRKPPTTVKSSGTTRTARTPPR